MEFAMAFKLLGLGVVLGVGSIVLRQLGREDIASIAVIVATVLAIGGVIYPIADAFSKAMSVFRIM